MAPVKICGSTNPVTLVKICGLTNPEDAQAAMELGADLLGFVNADNSPRYLTPDEISRIISEVQPIVPTVMVTHSQDTSEILNSFDAARADILQLHAPLLLGEYSELKERVSTIIANVSIEAGLKSPTEELKRRVAKVSKTVDYILLDTKVGKEIGGTGVPYDWSVAAELKAFSKKPVIIAGGLNPLNVALAVKQVKPFAVDVSSGVESEVGLKDRTKLEAFIKRAKLALL